MDLIPEILSLNNILGIMFLVSLILQHQRSKERDKGFFSVIDAMSSLLKNCQDEIAKKD